MTPEEEADQLMRLDPGGSTWRLLEFLERQFGVLHNRAQVLLGLSGVVVTVTGFSGRIIAGTHALAQGLIISGLVMTLLAAAVAVRGVLHLQWLTQFPLQAGDVRQWLVACLGYRNRKTRAYRLAILMLLTGLTLYVSALALMLANPTAGALPPAR